MVTSASPGEGKSLIAANLAVVFAQGDRRTVLISADLRRPTLNDTFSESTPSPGLTDLVLYGSVGRGGPPSSNGTNDSNGSVVKPITPAGVLVKTGVPNLLLLPSGPVPPNPAEIIGSKRFAGILDEYATAADMVIIDTPPLLPVTDAAVLAERVDGIVLVVAMNETRREGLKRAMSILEGTGVRVLGVVVNKTTSSGSGYYYGDDAHHAGQPARRWPFRSKDGQPASKRSAGTTRESSLTPDHPAAEKRSARAEIN